jgi:hypothetical protein
MKIPHLRPFWLLLLTGILSSCAQPTSVVKLYDETARSNHQYERFLIIGIAGDEETRQRLEDMIVEHLRAAGADAVPGHAETGMKTALLQEEINAAARHANADAIMVTHIISVDTKTEIEEGRIDTVAECRGGDPADYFLYNYEELKEPDSVKLAHTVVAITNLYETIDGKRVWSIQSTCFDKASMNEVLVDEAKAIARQMRIDNLIG